MDNPHSYRTKEEEDEWRKRDPLTLFRKRVTKEKTLKAKEMDAIDKEVEDMIEEAVKLADESPLPEPSKILEDVYGDYPQDLLIRGTHIPLEAIQ